MYTVFAGSISLTTFVTTIFSIDHGVLLARVVTVSILSEVRMRVRISGTTAATAAEVVAAEPPSTATTEYATRLRTAGCLGDWGFIGKAYERKDSSDMIRKDVMRIVLR